MNRQLSVLAQKVLPADGTSGGWQRRDWRLLAYLIWQTHLAEIDGQDPPIFSREALATPLGASGRSGVDNALSALRGMLRAIGDEGRLVEERSTAAHLTGLDGFACDLVLLLRAAQARNVGELLRLLTPHFGRNSLELLREGLKPRPLDQQVHTRWIDELVEYLSAPLGPDRRSGRPERDAATTAYLNAHVTACSTLDPRLIGGRTDASHRPVPLEDVYVSLILGPEDSAEVAADREYTADVQGAITQRALDDLLTFADAEPGLGVQFGEVLRTRRWVVIIGDPGSGKTTLLQWLALFNARALLDEQDRLEVDGTRLGIDAGHVDLGPSRLPVLFRAADYARAVAEGSALPDVIDYVGLAPLQGEDLPIPAEEANQLIRRWLHAGRALVLVDGLDEVGDSLRRAEVVKQIERFTREHVVDPVDASSAQPWSGPNRERWWDSRASDPAESAGNQIVITSRRHAYKQTALVGPFTIVQVQPLQPSGIVRFCRRWTLAVEHAAAWQDPSTPRHEVEQRAAAAAEHLLDAIRHPNIRRLATNPLLLTVLAMIDASSEELPTRRLDLYEQATRVLVTRRELRWGFEEVRDILGPFALWLQAEKAAGYASREELERLLREGLQRHGADSHEPIQEFIEEAHSQAGLLVELGPDRYGFTHNTFREYLAAVEISRDPDRFSGWLLEHVHAVLWIEVVLMGIASVAQRFPDRTDDLLREVLAHQPDVERLLHHDLLLVADCLAESQQGSAEFVTEVVERLLRVAVESDATRVRGLARRATHALTHILERRPQVARPLLIAALDRPRTHRIATDVFAATTVSGIEALEALDRVCRRADRSPNAEPTRAEVARRTLLDGLPVDERLRPIGSLIARGARYADSFSALQEHAPRLADALADARNEIAPGLYDFARWILAYTADRDPLPETDLRELVVQRALNALRTAKGSDFSAIARFAAHIDTARLRTALKTLYADGAVDVDSCARLFADSPVLLPSIFDFTDWTDELSPEAVTGLLEHHHPMHRVMLLDLAWDQLGAPLTDRARDVARRLLEAVVSDFRYLPASSAAIRALRIVIDDADVDLRAFGRVLLGQLRCDWIEGIDDAMEALLETILATPEDPLRPLAAMLLLQAPGRPVTLEQYEMVAGVLAEDDPLRWEAMRTLRATRRSEHVPDAVFARSSELMRETAESDPAVSSCHSFFRMNAEWHEVDRALASILDPEAEPIGDLDPAVAAAVLRAIPDAEPQVALDLAWACWSQDPRFMGADRALLAELCFAADGSLRRILAALLAAESVLASAAPELEAFLAKLAEHDAPAAGHALLMAADVIPSATEPGRMVEALVHVSRTCRALRDDPAPEVTAGLLAVDALVRPDPESVLDGLAARAATADEIASALLDGLESELAWHDLTPFGGPAPDPRSVLARRVAMVACAFTRTTRGMEAFVEAAKARLLARRWVARRAACFGLNTVATTSPGLFLQAAELLELRPLVTRLAKDHMSWSVRWLVVSLLSQFRKLDPTVVEVLAAACRDEALSEIATVERCRVFGGDASLDTDEVTALVDSSNPRSVLIGTTLLATLGRDNELRRGEAVAVLSARAAFPDPLLDCATDENGRTLREVLISSLSSLMWELPEREALAAAVPAAELRRFNARDLEMTLESLGPTFDFVSAIRGIGFGWLARPVSGIAPGAGLAWNTLFGVSLPPAQDALYKSAVGLVLALRTGMAIASAMPMAMLDEFEPMIDHLTDGEGQAWLERYNPGYETTVKELAADLAAEIRSGAPAVLAALEAATHGDLADRAREEVGKLGAKLDEPTWMADADLLGEQMSRHGYAMRVAAQLELLGYFDAARDALLVALRLLDLSEPDDDVERRDLLRAIGEMTLKVGDDAAALDWYERALEGTDGLDDAAVRNALGSLFAALAATDLDAALARLDVERRRRARAGEALTGWFTQRQLVLRRDLAVHAHRSGELDAALAQLVPLAEQLADDPALVAWQHHVERLIGAVHLDAGELDAAETWYDRALAGQAEIGDEDEIEAALHGLIAALRRRDPAVAIERVERELELRRASETQTSLLAQARLSLYVDVGQALIRGGQADEARPLFEALLAELEAEDSGSSSWASFFRHELGVMALDRDLDAAIALLDRALADRAAGGELSSRGAVSSLVALVSAIGRRDPHVALERLEAEAELRRGTGMSAEDAQKIVRQRAFLQVERGRHLGASGDREGAIEQLEAARETAQTLEGPGARYAPIASHEIGNVLLAAGRPEQAVERYETALAELAALGDESSQSVELALIGAIRARARVDLDAALERLATELEQRRRAGAEAAFLDRVALVASDVRVSAARAGGEHTRAILEAGVEDAERFGGWHATLLLHDLGNHWLDEDAKVAADYYARALAIGRQVSRNSGQLVVPVLSTLVHALSKHDLTAALERLEAESAAFEALGLLDDAARATLTTARTQAYIQHGRALLRDGHNERARATFEQGLAELHAAERPDQMLIWVLTHDIANVIVDEDPAAAAELYEQALAGKVGLGATVEHGTISTVIALARALAKLDRANGLARLDVEIAAREDELDDDGRARLLEVRAELAGDLDADAPPTVAR